MTQVYTAHATAIGGRNGRVETDDKNLAVELASPDGSSDKETTWPITNPEQLFACGYAACFGSALEAAALQQKIEVGEHVSVTAHISVIKNEAGGFRIAAELEAAIPDVDSGMVKKLMDEAHKICPYSKAIRGNIDVELKYPS